MKAKTEAVTAYLLLAAACVALSALTGGAWSVAALAASCVAGGRAGSLIGTPTPPAERGYMGPPGPMGPKGDRGPTGSPGMTATEWEAVLDRRTKALMERAERTDDDTR